MSIATAEVLPSTDYRGAWTLQVTGRWAASLVNFADDADTTVPFNHAQFPLTPDATPKVVLTVQSTGFTRSGGQAVATIHTRTVVATKVLRRPYTDGVPNGSGSTQDVPLLQEQDLGGGDRRVWLALSEPIYAGETVTVDFAAGWRSGHAGAAGVAVLNNSDRAYPLPIARWAQPQMMPVIGGATHRAEMIIASHFPRHFGAVANQAVAAVRLQATDGTNLLPPVWVTEDSVSPLFGDNLLCWGATMDFNGLSPGMVQVRATIYPWIGAARTIGTTLVTTGAGAFGVQADIPLVFGYDPADTHFRRRYVYVNAATGTATAAAVTVATGIAAAKAGTAAASLSVALQAMQALDIDLPPTNGFPFINRSACYWEAILAPGNQVIGTQAVSTSDLANVGYLTVRGDPDDADPRANCILQSPSAAAPNLRNPNYRLRDCTVELGDVSFGSTWARTWLDNVTVRRRTGIANEGLFFSSSPPAAGLGNMVCTRFTWSQYGSIAGSNCRAILLRNGITQAARSNTGAAAKVLINLTTQPYAGHSYVGGTSGTDFDLWSAAGSETADNMAWNLKGMRNNRRALTLGRAFVDGDGFDVVHRTAVVNTLFERANAETEYKLVQIGENSPDRQTECIWEGGTWVGQRVSWHNDPPVATANLRQDVFVRNCYWDRISSKDDRFPTASGNRTGTWALQYGTGIKAMVVGERSLLGPQFQFQYYGEGAVRAPASTGSGAVSNAAFVDDRCNWGPNATGTIPNQIGAGNGDYRPGIGSVLLGAAVACNTNRDLGGAERGLAFAAGALEGAEQDARALVVHDAVHQVTGAGPRVAVPAPLRAERGRLPISNDGPVLTPVRPVQPSQGTSALRAIRVRAESRIEISSGE